MASRRALAVLAAALVVLPGSASAHHKPDRPHGRPTTTTTTTVPSTTTSTTAPATNVYTVPATVAADCSQDVTAELNAWLATVPNGTSALPNVARFSGGCYRVDGTLGAPYGSTVPAGYQRAHLIIDGQGATIEGSVVLPPPFTNRAGLSFIEADDVTVQGFTILGNHPNPCNLSASGACQDGGYDSSREWQHGIAFFGSHAVTARLNTIRNVYGDCVTLAQDPQTTNALVEANTCDGTGRMGVALTSNDGATIRGNTFDRVSYHVVDIEPEVMGVRNVEFSGNTIGRHYLGVVASGSGECVERSNIVVADNVMTHAGVTTWPPYVFDAPAHCAPMTDLTFTGNTVLKADGGAGPPAWHNAAVRVQHVHNARVNGNRIIQTRADTGAVAFFGATGLLEASGNDMREVGFVYSVDGVEHGGGVFACGNTTSQGTDQPAPC